MQTSQWVDEKLTALNAGPGCEWQPNAARALHQIQSRRQQHVTRRSRWIWASATVLAGGLGSMAFPAPRAVMAQRVLAPCIGACESLFAGKVGSGGSIANNPVPAIGDLAPDFTAIGANGTFLRLADYRGKVVLLNFWAIWCPPCRAEIPWFVEFQQRYGERGLAVIGLSMDEGGWKTVRPFQKAHGIQYMLGIGGGALAQKFSVDSLPETLLIARDGRIAAKYTGIVSRAEYQGAIEKLLPQ